MVEERKNLLNRINNRTIDYCWIDSALMSSMAWVKSCYSEN